jgi:tRNA(Arg) A34 adenosine deaminase TadA
MNFPSVAIILPEWVSILIGEDERSYHSVEERMRLVIGLARLNIRKGGGPFAAAIFDSQTQRLIAPGINMVVKNNCSVLHAEMVAIMVAQKIIGSYTLASDPARHFELVTTTEPCAMCMGAIPWSGVQGIVCGARDADARAYGFDEGIKPVAWIQRLSEIGISVQGDVLREDSLTLFREYAEISGIIYNGRV